MSAWSDPRRGAGDQAKADIGDLFDRLTGQPRHHDLTRAAPELQMRDVARGEPPVEDRGHRKIAPSRDPKIARNRQAARLGELQAAKGEGDLTVISPEQQEEIQRFMERRLEIRRELRQVQHDLRRDIDRLDMQIKFINIVLVPAAVMAVAIVYAIRRRKRQDRVQAKGAEA